MGAVCCSEDPSQSQYQNMDKTKEGPSPTDSPPSTTGANGYSKEIAQETTPYSQEPTEVPKTQSIPGNSYLKPTNNETEQIEESLNVPTGSVLDTVTDHDQILPSDYEDNAEDYAIKPEETIPDNDGNNGYEPGNDSVNEQKEQSYTENGTDKTEIETETETETYEEEPKPTKHKQIIILENEDLRDRSVALVTGDNDEFIKFLKKILKSKLSEKIWNKCDPNNTGKIETEKFMYFWTLPVTLFKVAIYQRKHGNKQKPKLDQKDLRKDFTHLATWIVRRYGEKQSDGGATFTLTKENFTKDIVEYVQNYGDTKGELYEDY